MSESIFCFLLHRVGIATEQVLSETDVCTLVDLIHNFSDKWNCIGLRLGFIQPELNKIRAMPLLLSTAPKSYLTELLSQWVQWPTVDHPTKPTLRALCEALCSSSVGLGSLAEMIEREMTCPTAGKGSIAVICIKLYVI